MVTRTDLFRKQYDVVCVNVDGLKVECFTDEERYFMTIEQVTKCLGINDSTLHNIVKNIRKDHKYFAPGGVYRLHELKTIQSKLDNYKQRFAKDGFVYLITDRGSDLTKIGITTNIKVRINHLSTMVPMGLKDIYSVKVEDYKEVEKELHNLYEYKRVNGEWFDLNDVEKKAIKKRLESIKLENGVAN